MHGFQKYQRANTGSLVGQFLFLYHIIFSLLFSMISVFRCAANFCCQGMQQKETEQNVKKGTNGKLSLMLFSSGSLLQSKQKSWNQDGRLIM